MIRKKLLLTGKPGSGKTTAIKSVVRTLQQRGVDLAGITTGEIRDPRSGERVGFSFDTLSQGTTGELSHIGLRGRVPLCVGKYGVNIAAIDSTIVNELQRPCSFCVIDEIGKMECLSPRFCECVVKLLDNPTLPVLGTIAQVGPQFIEAVKARKDVHVITLTPSNRNTIPALLLAELGF
ncbi:AAA family ATPase [Pelomyxa schiedti]|nr:AAA family ATPase [Pelomyxa schiedti]